METIIIHKQRTSADVESTYEGDVRVELVTSLDMRRITAADVEAPMKEL